MLLHSSDTLSVRGHFRTGVNLVAEDNLFWELAARAAGNTTFDPDARWAEYFIEPGLGFERHMNPGTDFFGKISAVASYTSGRDALALLNFEWVETI